MRKYQVELRARNELQQLIKGRQALGKATANQEAALIRLNAALVNNPVSKLVEEGLFTSIVEEFGVDEESTRRKLTTKLLDKVGGFTGTQGAVKVSQEIFMVPGSETAQLALMATQYGDFVGRFVKYNWDTKVKNMDDRTALHESLDTFIYYNVPQNKYLQFLNDNGGMMFTKFFFRIQRIILRTFKRNPVQATVVFGLQGMTESRMTGENIANYAFLHNGLNKFEPTPWTHVTNGDIFFPSIFRWFKWLPDIFWGDGA